MFHHTVLVLQKINKKLIHWESCASQKLWCYRATRWCKAAKQEKSVSFFFFLFLNLLCIPLWIKAEERDRGLMVTAVTSLWLIFSLHLCEMQVWLWHADALFLFSHEDETRRDSGFAGACWSCLSSLLASSSAFILTTFFSLFSIFVLAFMHPPFFYLSLLVCLKNICPAETCSPFSCFYGLGCCLFPWIWQKWHKHTRK